MLSMAACALTAALRLLERLAFHDTPKHGSWLSMAAPEVSVLARQCLDRPMPDPDLPRREISASTPPNSRKERVRSSGRVGTFALRLIFPVASIAPLQLCSGDTPVPA